MRQFTPFCRKGYQYRAKAKMAGILVSGKFLKALLKSQEFLTFSPIHLQGCPLPKFPILLVCDLRLPTPVLILGSVT